MNKILTGMAVTLFLGINAWATPPSSLEADYVKAEGTLYIYMEHLSRDHTRHYIRKVEVLRNGEEVASKSNRQQVDPNHYALSIDVQADVGDELTVTAYCSEGGTKSVSVTVAKADKEAKPSEVKAKVEGLKEKKEQVDVYESKEDPMQGKGY